MQPGQNSWHSTRRLEYASASPLQRLLGTLFAAAVGTTVLVLGFMFSVVILAAAAVIGVAGFGYLWWQTRAIRKQMRERMRQMQEEETVPGDVIEGEVIDDSSRHRP